MRKAAKLISSAASVVTLLGALGMVPTITNAAEVDSAVLEEGKKLAENRKKGNCLACHLIPGGTLPGTIGPPLMDMKTRYPDKAGIASQLYDPRVRNPNTMMPPFGAHGILSKEEIDKIVEYIYSL